MTSATIGFEPNEWFKLRPTFDPVKVTAVDGYHRVMVRAILFDFNGVLVDDEPIHLALFGTVLEDFGVSFDIDAHAEELVGLDDRAGFTLLLRSNGRDVKPDVLSRLIARKASSYQTRIRAQGFPVFPGAAERIEEAHAAGLTLGIVSGALRAEIEGALRQLDWTHRFKVVVSAEDVEIGKPDPSGYRLGLERLNATPPLPSRLLHPHEVLAIEDTPAGLSAARAAGLTTVGVAQTLEATRLAEADRVVTSLEAVRLEDLVVSRD